MMRPLRIIVRCLLVVVCVFVVLRLSHAGIDDFDTSNNQVSLDAFISGGPQKDGIPSLDDPVFVPAENADYLANDDMVVGIEINGQAKAYPIKLLNWHEIVNDRIGKTPYAVTWCPLTRSAATFDRRVDGQTLEFGVSGLLYNSNVVMYDRNHDGLWSQLKMGGLTGKHADENLDLLASELTTWKEWRQKHPDTLVLSKKTGHWRDYSKDPYSSYHRQAGVMFPLTNYDGRLPQKDLIVGVKIKGIAKAYPLEQLDDTIEDRIGDMAIKVIPRENKSALVKDKDGNILPSVVAYWFAWSTFNKDTLVYKK